jgi:hypothetical protein
MFHLNLICSIFCLRHDGDVWPFSVKDQWVVSNVIFTNNAVMNTLVCVFWCPYIRISIQPILKKSGSLDIHILPLVDYARPFPKMVVSIFEPLVRHPSRQGAHGGASCSSHGSWEAKREEKISSRSHNPLWGLALNGLTHPTETPPLKGPTTSQ